MKELIYQRQGEEWVNVWLGDELIAYTKQIPMPDHEDVNIKGITILQWACRRLGIKPEVRVKATNRYGRNLIGRYITFKQAKQCIEFINK